MPERFASAGTNPDAPSPDRFIVVVWRHKWILLATFLAITAATAAVSKSLPKEYEATAVLWVTEESGTAAFDAVQAGEVLARTYSQVADSPILAARVARELPFDASSGEVEGAMSIEPVSETQLLEVVAAQEGPDRARILANAYAGAFIEYSSTKLGETARSEIAFADRASTPRQPARPKPTLYTLVGAMIGLLAGIGMAFLAELLDRRVRSVDELEELLDAPPLAHVPVLTGDALTSAAFDETFRLLGTNLQFLDPELKSVVVVSPSESDGKSSVSYHLARAIAEAGTEVILVEADMRRPGLSRLVFPKGSEAPHEGLSTYLTRMSPELGSVILQTSVPRLSFVPAGVLPQAPSTLLDATRTRMLLKEAGRRAELIIIDTPPLSVGAEASTLAGTCDGALVVVDLRVSSKRAVRAARQQLRVVGARVLGVVVNRVRAVPDMGAYAYRYRSAANGETGRRGGRRRRVAEPR
jgi:polysaccharide biosynthesis transport protein